MMDWRTILAVAISVVLIIAVPLLVPVIFPAQKTAAPTSKPAPAAPPTATAQPAAASAPQATAPPAGAAAGTAPAAAAPVGTGRVVADPAGSQAPPTQPALVVRETDTLILTFETAGADVASIKLKEYRNLDGSPVELVLTGESAERPFAIAFGDHLAAPEKGPFVLREYAEGRRRMLEFSKAMLSATGIPFTLKKTYVVMDGEYLIELKVAIENSVNDVPALERADSPGVGYTFFVGPQIGPAFKKLDNRNDSRSFVYWWLNAKGALERKKEAATGGKARTLDRTVTWAGVIGKYFTIIAVPPVDQAKLVLDARVLVPGAIRSALAFSRSPLRASRAEDVWRFYVGPMQAKVMERYDKAEANGFGIRDLNVDAAIDKPGILGPIVEVLRWLLVKFVELIPNWGVAIILLTLVTKVVFLPLTFKSSESMARMAALNPKIQEIRTRLKDKPERMNQEMALLYKKEKVNPLSGCLPLLLQIPIFFALYTLLNTQFELRGAMFIPGWIPDLSVPESVYELPQAFLGISDIRLLPLIMLGTQLLSSKIMQPPSADASGAQMKLLNYAMPVVFLFMLYNMPAGLTLYWTVQNVLSIVQQVYINWLRQRKPKAPVPA
jgi:YidC/Oxa1 family membrane protein insertase